MDFSRVCTRFPIKTRAPCAFSQSSVGSGSTLPRDSRAISTSDAPFTEKRASRKTRRKTAPLVSWGALLNAATHNGSIRPFITAAPRFWHKSATLWWSGQVNLRCFHCAVVRNRDHFSARLQPLVRTMACSAASCPLVVVVGRCSPRPSGVRKSSGSRSNSASGETPTVRISASVST